MRAMRASVVYVPTGQRANVPKACQILSEGVPIFQFHLPLGIPIFQLLLKRISQFFNFLIFLNICKFQEYLGNS